MIVLPATGGLAATNCYLIGDEAAQLAVLFDAPNDTVAPLLDETRRRGWDLIGLWLTHGHWDHLADHAVVTQAFSNARLLIHPLDEPKLKTPGSAMFPLPFAIPARGADALLEDGQKLRIGSIEVDVIHTPGHSPGHVCFHLPRENVLIGGDLIICGAVGRTDLPDSDPRALDESIRRIMRLPDATQLLPGHCDASTLGAERAHNPFVQSALN
ncbi:MAG: MBL fold metallo-hydrolase [Tepidisphaeraceae bacterium]